MSDVKTHSGNRAEKKTLTLGMIDRLKPGEKTGTDASHPGLYVQRNFDGSRSWRYLRKAGPAIVKRTLGNYTDYSLVDARLWVADLNRIIASGSNPNEVDRLERERQAAESVAQAAVDRRRAMTLRTAWTEYISRLEREGNHVARTLEMKRSRWNLDILPVLGERSINEITHDDLWAIVERKKEVGFPSASNHLVPDIKVFFRWCMTYGRTFVGLQHNPAHDLIKLSKDKKRTRTFRLQELRLFVRALGQVEDETTQRFMLLCLLSGQRRDNILRARPTEWCKESEAWEIEKTKNEDPNVVPLGLWGRSLMMVDTAHVFPSVRGDGPRLGHITVMYRTVAAKMVELKGADVDRWSPHDFRRVISYHLSRLKVPERVVEMILAHRIPGVEGVYKNPFAYIDQKREALLKWEMEVSRLAIEEGVADKLGIPSATITSIAV